METLLSQAELLPSLLAASHSGLVRGWDAAAVRRALSWGRFFQGLHARLPPERGLRAAVERRLLRGRGAPLGLGHLKRCPELLGLALLENPALPHGARRALLRALLHDGDGERGAHRQARRKAAAQLLLLLLPSASPPPPEAPQARAQGQLLLARLREAGGEEAALLERLPCGPALHKAVAAALLEPGGEAEARAALLPWLLREQPRLAAFFRLLPAPWAASVCSRCPELRAPYWSLLAAWGARLRYDPLCGEWRPGGPEEGEAPWQEVRERVGCLCQGPEPLRSAVLAQLKDLKAQDGDFEVGGLSVWTDLLLDVQASASKEQLTRSLRPSAKSLENIEQTLYPKEG